MMYDVVRYVHSIWAYVVVLMTLVAFIYFSVKFFGKRSLVDRDRKMALFTLIAVHVQFLIGLILYTLSPLVHLAFSDFGHAMKDGTLRLIALEHPLAMITAVVLVTIAYRTVKKQTKRNEPTSTGLVLLFLFTLLLILSRIPWGLWFAA